MVQNFTAHEIYVMAEQIERNGAEFYRKAAEGFSEDETGKFLLGLAAMENDHLETFALMRKELTDKERVSTVFDPDNQTDSYLRAMASDHVFNIDEKPAARLTGEETIQDILKTAIQLEKDSIIFYLGMKASVSPEKGRKRLDDIIEEEFRHIAALGDELNSLNPSAD